MPIFLPPIIIIIIPALYYQLLQQICGRVAFSDSANLYHYALGNLPSFLYPYDYERNETNEQTDESETVKRYLSHERYVLPRRQEKTKNNGTEKLRVRLRSYFISRIDWNESYKDKHTKHTKHTSIRH